jgi:hypothetical protein
MTINVSLDGTGAAYERVRVGAKFGEVKANIRKLKEVVLRAPSPKANIGISMCVMKSNIHDLPNLVRFARDETLQFGMSPVVTMPPDESLRCFNDPAADMAGWSEAIDAAKAELESYFPSLAKVWRVQEVPEEQKVTWNNLFEVLRSQIPFELVKIPHRRLTVEIPEFLITCAIAKHGNQPLVAYFYRQAESDGISYWGWIKDRRCEVSLPEGKFGIGVSTKWTTTGPEGFTIETTATKPVKISCDARYTPRSIAMALLRRTRQILMPAVSNMNR